MKDLIMKYAPWVIALIMASSALWAWYHPRVEYREKPVWQDRTVTLTKTKYLPAKLETPDCTVKTVDADGDKQPDTLNGNPVTAIGDTPASKTGFDIRTTMTTSTGETRIYVQPKKLPLFGFENDKEIGMRYGLRAEYDVFGRWTFARVGAFYAAVYAEANTRPEGNIMIEGSYRW